MKIKVLALTGIRSDYDILYPVLDALRKDRLFDLRLAVSGGHLSDWHRNTIQLIEKDGFHICDRIDSLFMTNRVVQRAKGAGILTYALAQTVEREKPDMILVVGDREESIAAATVGTYMNVLTVHLGGGDLVYGNADDPMRFAVSKLAHVHLCFCRQSADNLIKAGEEKFRIFNVGNPSLDNIQQIKPVALSRITKDIDFNLDAKRYIMVLFHPLSSEQKQASQQMENLLKAVEEFCEQNDFKAVGIRPNTDPGSYDIQQAIERCSNPRIKFFNTLPREQFVNLLRNAQALVGNSSMGILEAPFYRLPVVNVGNRQKGRLNAGNVEFVPAQCAAIKRAIEKACLDQTYRQKVMKLKNPYGEGDSATRAVEVLKKVGPHIQKFMIKRNVWTKGE